jgi:hypothetical protein
MNTLKENNFQPWIDLTPEEKYNLQQICRDSIIEPFEGRKGLETIQKTRTNIEKGIGKLKKISKSTRDKIKDSRWLETSKSKLGDLITDAKKKSKTTQLPGILTKLNFITDKLPQSTIFKFEKLEKKLSDLALELQKATKSGYKNLGTKTKEAALIYTKKGLELLLYEDTESWILGRANKTLSRSDIDSIEKIRNLNHVERNILIDKLYPYDSPNYSILMEKFESGTNITLGAIVATNFPGTGIAVGLFNMGKTLIKLGNRINIISSIYGYKISSPEALFKVSATILKSMDDWEDNIEHIPLSVDILDDLYLQDNQDEKSAFQDLLNAVVKKEAYIAIPGIGMISLGKINLDDFKMDVLIKHLVQNYFNKNQLVHQIGEKQFQTILTDYQLIYSTFMKHQYFQKIRKATEKEKLQKSNKKWQTRLQLMAGIDFALESASTDLNRFTEDIFEKISGLKKESDKQKIIQIEIERFLKTLDPLKTD